MREKHARSVLSVALAASMVISSAAPVSAASSDPNASAAREEANAQISQDAAEQGMVLLENQENALPLADDEKKVALFGAGTYATVKGGTGSGDVYLKDEIDWSVYGAFKADSSYDIVNKEQIDALSAKNDEYVANWKGGMFDIRPVIDEDPYTESDLSVAADDVTAIYTLARTSGEGADRNAAPGDYYLTDNERENLKKIAAAGFKKVIVVLNVGGVVDTNFFNGKGGYADDDELNRGKVEGLDALVLMSQAGQRGGNALINVLNGTTTPSGKLTDTWAIDYLDYPSSADFSHNDALTADKLLAGEGTTGGETLEEIYRDDIYVGYRYFDTYGKSVAYPFGYGLSYTSFDMDVKGVSADEDTVSVSVKVSNTGAVKGKEVVQVYFSAPAGKIDKPYQELAAYKKVEVKAGKSKMVTVKFDTKDMSSYSEDDQAYVMEAGDYKIRVGNSSRNTIEAETITLDKDVTTEKCDVLLGATRKDLQEGTYADGVVQNNTYTKDDKGNNVPEPHYGTEKIDGILTGSTDGIAADDFSQDGLSAAEGTGIALAGDEFPAAKTYDYDREKITTYVSSNEGTDSAKYAAGKSDTEKEVFQKVDKVGDASDVTLIDVVNGTITMEQLVANMSDKELADLVEGGSMSGMDAAAVSAVVGSQADSVMGAAGETTSNLYAGRYIPNIVLSDGPAGIRITSEYIDYTRVEPTDAYDAAKTYYTGKYSWSGTVYTEQKFANEAEFRAKLADEALYTTDGVTYYQYCTAFPVGTMLAQAWDPSVIEEVGRAVADEMLEYGIASWLAPGMNIHRNPLCGRNFEYYSEDPLIAGKCAAAETRGVETRADGSESGVGVTIKHFAFNNQEDTRMGSNSVVSERASREIYLKGFEIAVREAKPDYIMSSYNMSNGCPTFENYGLLTEILKNEWGFDGFVMTDWYSISGVKGKNKDKNVQAMLMFAGNDCEMPGASENSLLKGLEAGDIMRLGDLQRSAIHMLNVIQRTPAFKELQKKVSKQGAQDAKDLEQAKKDLADAKKDLNAMTAGNAALAASNAALAASNAAVSSAAAIASSQAVAASKAAIEAQKKVEELEKKVTSLQKKVKTVIKPNKNKYTVKRKKKVTIYVTVTNTNGKKVKFKSAKTKIAKVNGKGVVTGVKKGSTKITISCNGVKKKVTIKVK